MTERRTHQTTALFVIICIAWCAFVVWLQHVRLSAGVHYEYEDDALYLQMLHLVGDGLVPYNTIHPLHRPSHLTPAFFALWPLYWLLGSGWTAVFIIKAICIGGAAVPIYLYAQRRTSARLALVLAALWLIAAPTLALVQSTLRPLTLAAGPLMAMLLSYADTRLRSTMFWAVIVLTFREDLALTILLLAGIAVWERRPSRWAVYLGGLAITWLLLSTQVLLPLILPADYSSVILTTNLTGGLSMSERFTEPSHLGAVLVILASSGFLPLRSRLTLVGGVGLAAILLNRHVLTANLVHLTMPWAVAAFAGAVHVATMQHSARRTTLLVLCTIAIHVQPFLPPTVHIAPSIQDATDSATVTAWSPLHPGNFEISQRDLDRQAAVRLIPQTASVAAVGHFLPLLVPRAKVYEYGHGYVTFTTAEWILLEATRVSTGAGGHISLTTEELQRHLDLLHSAGWTTTHTVGHVHVLRRDTSAPHGLAERIRKLTTSRVAPSPQATTGAQQRSTTQNQEQQRRN